jgi:hypothetical protein
VPEISLTDFVDIVSKSGTPKATKVAQVKARPDYEPAFDFYKALREAIVDIHKDGNQRASLTAFMQTVADPKKRKNYPPVIAGYRRWWGKKDLEWFAPRRTVYSQYGVDVIINPELGLAIDGARHMIKLYFKDDTLSLRRVDIITRLMQHTLHAMSQPGDVMSVLDVRNARLFPFRATGASMAMIDAELAYIAALWPQV